MLKKILKKLENKKLLVVLVLLLLTVNIFVIINTFSEKTSSTIWDGSIANNFKNGDGTLDNPYIISNGSELAYFFKCINGENNLDYFNRYFQLENNIDLDGKDFSFAKFGKTFSGSLNGNGYTISNFKISNYYLSDDKTSAYFSLFDSLDSAYIKNLNLSDINLYGGSDIEVEKIDKIESEIKGNAEEISENINVEDTTSDIGTFNVESLVEENPIDEENEQTENAIDENDKESSEIVEKNVDEELDNTEEIIPSENIDDDSNEQTENTTLDNENNSNEQEKIEDEILVPDVNEENDEIENNTHDEENTDVEIEDIDEKIYVNNIYVGLFSSAKSTSFDNINIYNIEIKNENDSIETDSSLFLINDESNNTLTNIHINGKSSINNTSILINKYDNSEIKRILYSDSLSVLVNGYEGDTETLLKYSDKDSVKFNNNYSIKSVVEMLNNNSEFNWVFSNNKFRIQNNGVEETRPRPLLKMARPAPSAHDSGIDGNVVYVNDYEADANYYDGLKYTYNTDNTLPTLTEKSVYSDNTLVHVESHYYGSDITGTYTGTVSINETQNEFVYYKLLEINNNGTASNLNDDYIVIDLIDVPFTRRPNNRVFNGWASDYKDSNGNSAFIYLDKTIYTRKAKVPVTYNNNIPNSININFYSVWGVAHNVTNLGANTQWADAFNNLANSGYHVISETVNTYENCSNYYYYGGSVANNGRYPTGSYQANGTYNANDQTRCRINSCPYYYRSDATYVSDRDYYRLQNGSMQRYYPTLISSTYNTDVPVDDSSAGYYRKTVILRYGSQEGYYNNNGDLLSGTCNTSGGCEVYELIQYYDNDGNPEVVHEGDELYYYTTRDTNIIVLTGNRTGTNYVGSWGTGQNKPFTLTAINNGTSYINSTYWNLGTNNINCYADTRIENIRLNSSAFQNNGNAPANNATFYGNFYNTKLGRGIVRYNNNNTTIATANGGGNISVGSASSLKKFVHYVESGFYNNGAGIASANDSSSYYLDGKVIYGNDYDRVNNDNSKLVVRYSYSTYWNGTSYGANTRTIAVTTYLKSGQIGSNKFDYAAGLYVGGRNNANAFRHSPMAFVMEGGYVYNLIGGPLSLDANKAFNDTYMYIKGGEVEVVVGGAGASGTTGNRIIQITGGKVNYSVFGGSNGATADGSSYTATLDGSTYIVIGGNAVIGDETAVNNRTLEPISQCEAGSVFGIGNGNSSSSTIGTANNSNIIILDGATILNNVYGGGNYAAAGQTGTRQTYSTNIVIHGGTINGSVYGGGNNNGSGSTSNTDNIVISMDGGEVLGSIYGGSRTKGTVYGSSTLNITNGIIHTDIYGGGEGGYQNNNNPGTFVLGNVDITLGNNTIGPTVNGNVYGGSAFGTVNATSTSATQDESKHVNVTVNKGNVIGSVFGGAKGSSTFTPYVKGIINVNINGGTVSNVYGGFDEAGRPEPIQLNYVEAEDIGDIEEDDPDEPDTSAFIYVNGMQRSAGASTTNDTFDKKSISSTVTLPAQNSTVTYKVNITNETSKNWGIYSITGLDSNLEYEITNYNMKDILCSGVVTKSIYITVKYKNGKYNSENTTYDINLNFNFRKVYEITYENFYTANHYPSDVITNNYYDASGNSININGIEYPKHIMERDSVSFDFYLNIPNRINVSSTATSSYTKPNLTISNPTGNVLVSNLTTGDIVMYDHPSSVTFNGNNNINTRIPLLSNANRNRNFRVEFTINSRGNNDNLATLFNVMDESGSPWPGIVFRVDNGQYHVEANGGQNGAAQNYGFNNVNNVVIEKIGGNVTASVNGSTPVRISNYSGFGYSFNIPATFGSSMQNTTTAWRYFRGTMSKMKVTFLDDETIFTPSEQPTPDTPDQVEKDNSSFIYVSGMERSAGVSTTNDTFNKKSISSTITLPAQNSIVTYKVDITNVTSKNWGIYNITGLDSNLEYEITNYNMKDILCSGTESKSIYITVKYKNGRFDAGNTTYDINLNFNFRKVYNITYENFYTANHYPSDVITNNYYDASGNSININGIEYPKHIMERDSVSFDFYLNIPNSINVSSTATSSYTKPNLTISNPTGNVLVSNLTTGDIVMYDHPSSVTFNGNNNINTRIPLLSNANRNRDFQVEFTVNSRGNNDTNATLFNAMDESGSPWPGVMLRIENNQYHAEANGGQNGAAQNFSFNNTDTFVIKKQNGNVTISVNGGNPVRLSNYSGFGYAFNTPATFGSSMQNTTTAWRYFRGTMSKMKITFLDNGTTFTPSAQPSPDTPDVPINPDEPTDPDTPDYPDIPANPIIPENTNGNVHVYLNGGTIGNAFGGGNNTSIDVTDINLQGATVNNVYGGSNNSGDVAIANVNVTSGTTDKVFGGNNVGGTCIRTNVDVSGGTITSSVYGGGNEVFTTATYVTISDCDTAIPSVYGGGNNVGTSDDSLGVTKTNVIVKSDAEIIDLYGGSNDNGIVELSNIRVFDGNITNVYGGGNNADANQINLDIDSGTISGNVFGGGNNANVNNVDIDIKNGTINTLYGGGNNGDVLYGITIDMADGTITNDIYGGGNNGSVAKTINLTTTGGTIEGSVYGGGKGSTATVGKNIIVNMSSTTIEEDIFGGGNAGAALSNTIVDLTSCDVNGTVYGGGNAADVNGKINVNITSSDIDGYVFGGGNEGESHSTVNVNIGSSSNIAHTVYGGGNAADVDGAIEVNVSSSTIQSDVIGGGNDGESHSTVSVNIIDSSEINGSVYGGGNAANVEGAIDVQITSSTINNNVFGGGNAGESNDNVSVVISDSSLIKGTVYGGGDAADVDGDIEVQITSSTINNDVFGGGNEGESHSTVNVTIEDSSLIKGTVYGGGDAADVDGVITVNIVDSDVKEDVYGGGNNGNALDSSLVNINEGAKVTGDVYGGGNNGTVANNSTLSIDGGSVSGSAFGGGKGSTAIVFGTSTVNVTSGTIEHDVFGGGNQAGVGNTVVNINVTNPEDLTLTNIYGGSNQSGAVVSTEINVHGGTIAAIYGGNNRGGSTTTNTINVDGGIIGDIFGGGNQAVTTDTNITIIGGTINNSVYGGGNAAQALGSTNLTINYGTIGQNVYGGGNQGVVKGNTKVIIANGEINGSAYAGGNGATATVEGNTYILVGGNSIIGTEECEVLSSCSVFGGGNAAKTGVESNNNSIAEVQIVGGTIYGNVYGGANTSKVFGETDVNIGADVEQDEGVLDGDIHIYGTVFGGGEANASGSDDYDWTFISVTNAISVNINGENYSLFQIDGSIFGSGNASTTTGTSEINIKNYGTFEEPARNISIQRTDILTIDNSNIILEGATDRTNDYSDVLFTLSIIDELDLTNNSTLFLETGANLLKEFKSLTSTGALAEVTIDENTKTVTKNVDNRIYMLAGKNLNIAKNSNVTDYGEVSGMTFFGMYKYNGDESVNVGIYDKFDYGETLDWGDVLNDGSYVLGLHKVNHDIKVDGFYTNYIDENTSKNIVNYIDPIPPSGAMYMWVVGESVIEYEFELSASKYSTLGTYELSLRDFTKPNTTFELLGFDYSGLASGVQLVEKNTIPRIASNATAADTLMGLTMETSNSGWLVNGSTYFLSNETDGPIVGTQNYIGGNNTLVPTLLFCLHHSKNITTAGSMGVVSIQLLAITQIDDLTKESERLIITIDLNRALYNTNDYEAAMTAGRKYSLFTSTATNITASSSISAYYSLFGVGESIYKTGYHRALVSNYVLPLNTKITMIDLSGDNPEYYYLVIDSDDVSAATTEFNIEGDVAYPLSMFEIMGAQNSGVYYDDVQKNIDYYDGTYSDEEFIFIVDFDDTNITSDSLNNSLKIEMLNADDETIISVLGVQQESLIYNIYAEEDAIIDIDGELSTNQIYAGEDVTVHADITYTQTQVGSVTIYDTHYFDSKLGVKISLIDSNGNIVTGTSLLGLYYTINNVNYYPNLDGTTRIKIADRVDTAETWIKVNTGTSSIPTDNYKLRIESFGSADGVYYGLNSSDHVDLDLEIINEIYGLDIQIAPEEMIINHETGLNTLGLDEMTYTFFYNSGLENPSIHVKMYRRNYDEMYDTDYTLVDAKDYFQNAFTDGNAPKEYTLLTNPSAEATYMFVPKEDLVTGTYKMEFILYSNNSAIGNVIKYFIIK